MRERKGHFKPPAKGRVEVLAEIRGQILDGDSWQSDYADLRCSHRRTRIDPRKCRSDI
jgi:hypothetical protein